LDPNFGKKKYINFFYLNVSPPHPLLFITFVKVVINISHFEIE